MAEQGICVFCDIVAGRADAYKVCEAGSTTDCSNAVTITW